MTIQTAAPIALRTAGFLLFVGLLVGGASTANAFTTYLYTGTNFTITDRPFDTDDSITAEFTVSTPFGPDFNGDALGLLMSFSMAAGPVVIPNGSQLLQFDVLTDAAGIIQMWAFRANDCPSGDTCPDPNTITSGNGFGLDTDSAFLGAPVSSLAAGSPNGTWFAAPEPSTLSLSVLGLVGLGIISRRRRTTC